MGVGGKANMFLELLTKRNSSPFAFNFEKEKESRYAGSKTSVKKKTPKV